MKGKDKYVAEGLRLILPNKINSFLAIVDVWQQLGDVEKKFVQLPFASWYLLLLIVIIITIFFLLLFRYLRSLLLYNSTINPYKYQ